MASNTFWLNLLRKVLKKVLKEKSPQKIPKKPFFYFFEFKTFVLWNFVLHLSPNHCDSQLIFRVCLILVQELLHFFVKKHPPILMNNKFIYFFKKSSITESEIPLAMNMPGHWAESCCKHAGFDVTQSMSTTATNSLNGKVFIGRP